MSDYTDWQDGEVKVVVNHEEQYSIWPADREAPDGWREVGVSGKKKKCLDYIEEFVMALQFSGIIDFTSSLKKLNNSKRKEKIKSLELRKKIEQKYALDIEFYQYIKKQKYWINEEKLSHFL